MRPILSPARVLRSFVTAVLAATISGCVDEPFTRANLNDENAEFDMRIVASRDTISPANPIVILRVVTDPIRIGYEPVWSASSASGMIHRGNGVFEQTSPAITPQTIQITAAFEFKQATITLVRMPTP
jgi:hypothetical protein